MNLAATAASAALGSWRRHRVAARLPRWCAAAIALFLWRVFYPALLSTDSITQYGQAVQRSYTDWHPPLMAIVLRLVLALGGTLGLLMLGQCLAGVFGLRALAVASLRALYGPRLSAIGREWLSLAVLFILLLPWTPLAFFLMTFWKDVWVAILLLWVGRWLLDLAAEGPSARRLTTLAMASIALGLMRHNAVVVLPVVGLATWTIASRWRLRRAIGWAVIPLLGWAIAGPLIDRLFDVEKLHPDSQVMTLDLVGLCAESRRVCAELPWTDRHILDRGALARYRPGDVGFLWWDRPPHVDPAIAGNYEALRSEYLRAALSHPWLLARLKAEAFVQLLGLEETYYYFHDQIVDNPYGLALNPRFARLRTALSARCGAFAIDPVLRWLSGVHLVWLLVNVAWIATLVILAWRWRDRARLELAIVLLLPLSYFLSYLLATPVHDFRFMYPATLFVQCVTLSAGAGALAQTPSGRAPSRATFSA